VPPGLADLLHRILHGAGAAERQELAGQRCGLLSSVLDVLELGAQLRVVLRPSQGHVGVSRDDREQVVEVVGRAALRGLGPDHRRIPIDARR